MLYTYWYMLVHDVVLTVIVLFISLSAEDGGGMVVACAISSVRPAVQRQQQASAYIVTRVESKIIVACLPLPATLLLLLKEEQ